MRARTVNESIDFKRDGNIKKAISVGEGRDINILLDTVIHEKAEAHGYTLYKDGKSPHDGRVIIYTSNPEDAIGISGWAKTNSITIQPVPIALRGTSTAIDRMSEQMYIVRVQRFYKNDNGSQRNREEYFSPRELWNEAWWDKIDKQLLDVPHMEDMYEAIDFKRGQGAKKSIGVGHVANNRERAEWVIDNILDLKGDWNYTSRTVNMFEHISLDLIKGGFTIAESLSRTRTKWPTIDYTKPSASDYMKKALYDKLIKDLESIGFIIIDPDYIRESVDFKRGQEAKKSMGIGGINTLLNTVLPRQAAAHGFDCWGDYTREEFGRNMTFVRKYGERVGYNKEVNESISTEKIWAKHRSSSRWDEIQEKMMDDYIITYSKTYNKEEEKHKSFEIEISPRDLFNNQWWVDIDQKMKDEGFTLDVK